MKKIILVYHQIDEQDKFMSVTFENFKRQMNYLINHNFNFCDIEELMKKNNRK